MIGVRLMFQASELGLPEILIGEPVFNACDLGSGGGPPDMSRALVIEIPVRLLSVRRWNDPHNLPARWLARTRNRVLTRAVGVLI